MCDVNKVHFPALSLQMPVMRMTWKPLSRLLNTSVEMTPRLQAARFAAPLRLTDVMNVFALFERTGSSVGVNSDQNTQCDRSGYRPTPAVSAAPPAHPSSLDWPLPSHMQASGSPAVLSQDIVGRERARGGGEAVQGGPPATRRTCNTAGRICAVAEPRTTPASPARPAAVPRRGRKAPHMSMAWTPQRRCTKHFLASCLHRFWISGIWHCLGVGFGARKGGRPVAQIDMECGRFPHILFGGPNSTDIMPPSSE